MAIKTTYTALLISTLMSGCSVLSGGNESATPSTDIRGGFLQKGNEEMLASISKSLQILAETRQGATQLNSTPEEMAKRAWLFSTTPSGMGVPMTIMDWAGHPVTALDMISSISGYELVQVGKPSPATRNVSLSYVSRPVIDVIRSVATQMGCDGRVDIHGAQRRMVVDWTIRGRQECSG